MHTNVSIYVKKNKCELKFMFHGVLPLLLQYTIQSAQSLRDTVVVKTSSTISV